YFSSKLATMRRSYTVIMMASLFLITTEAANMIYAQNCGKEEYNRCIALADPLVKDPHFIYPGNLKDIDNICRTWTLFVDCTKKYTEHCFEESKRKIFNKAVENSIELVHQMCTSPQYQTEYLKHASCLRTTLFDDSRCGKHYRSLASFISNETSGPSICCTHHRFRECVLDQTRRTCNQEDDSFTQQLLDKAFGFFRNQCRDYVPNQDECPGYEYYNVMTTNRWQDDKDSKEKGSLGPGASPSPYPSVSPGPLSTTRRRDDWNGGGGGPSSTPGVDDRTIRVNTLSGVERTSRVNTVPGVERTSRVNTVQGAERPNRVNTVQGGSFSTQPWQMTESNEATGTGIGQTAGTGQATMKPDYTNMIDEPNQQGLNGQNGAGSGPRASTVAALAIPAALWALAANAAGRL
ncbi:Hypothetical protein CINCED_3A025470, partial [Cinara cedri]